MMTCRNKKKCRYNVSEHWMNAQSYTGALTEYSFVYWVTFIWSMYGVVAG